MRNLHTLTSAYLCTLDFGSVRSSCHQPWQREMGVTKCCACCRPLSQRLIEAMALHWGYQNCQEYAAFHRLPLLHDWFINGNTLQQLLSLLVRTDFKLAASSVCDPACLAETAC